MVCRSQSWIYNLINISYSVLFDESAGKAGDLYIRSVCFSPDGKLLATGAEDKQIRVRYLPSLISLEYQPNTTPFRSGTSPRSGSAAFSMDTSKKFIP
jgi:WD domain, G-beta repeat.